MFTLYELKTSKCCSGVQKQPAYIRNIVLLGTLLFALLMIDIVYFKAEGASVYRIVRGLTSKTFNFLEGQSVALRHDTGITYENFEVASDDSFTVLEYLTECVSVSKPCAFIDLANCWKLNGFLQPDASNGMGTLLPTVDVYESSNEFSFKESTKETKSYADFEKSFATKKGTTSIRQVLDEDSEQYISLMKQISIPHFLAELTLVN